MLTPQPKATQGFVAASGSRSLSLASSCRLQELIFSWVVSVFLLCLIATWSTLACLLSLLVFTPHSISVEHDFFPFKFFSGEQRTSYDSVTGKHNSSWMT